MRWAAWILGFVLLACSTHSIGLVTAPGWHSRSVAVWRATHPDRLVASPHGRWMYISCRTPADPRHPSLIVYDQRSGKAHVLLRGLAFAGALAFAPDGSLWLAESVDHGRLWRIAEPDRLPFEQEVNRRQMDISHPAIAPLPAAGRMAFAALAFSRDGRYAYIADGSDPSILFRFAPDTHQLHFLDHQGHWRLIQHPDDASTEARQAKARVFAAIRDLLVLPDEDVLIAESGKGRILRLHQEHQSITLTPWITDTALRAPHHLLWDTRRHWLWISDGAHPNILWVWDGRHLVEIARHPEARITGMLLTEQDEVLINLQNERGPELTLKLVPEQRDE